MGRSLMGGPVPTSAPGLGCVRSWGTRWPGPLTCGVPQGVTLTDLQEAERTFSRSRAERQAQDQPGQKPVGTEGPEGQAEKPELATATTEDAEEGRQPSGQGLWGEVSCARTPVGSAVMGPLPLLARQCPGHVGGLAVSAWLRGKQPPAQTLTAGRLRPWQGCPVSCCPLGGTCFQALHPAAPSWPLRTPQPPPPDAGPRTAQGEGRGARAGRAASSGGTGMQPTFCRLRSSLGFGAPGLQLTDGTAGRRLR